MRVVAATLLILSAVEVMAAPPIVRLRPDDAQIARVASAWERAGVATRTQVTTPHGGRADLVAAGFAWEVESHADEWNTGVGQAVFYGADLELKPALALVAGRDDGRFVRRAEIACAAAGVTLVVVPDRGAVPLPPGKSALPGAAQVKKSAGDFTDAETAEVIAIGAAWCGPCQRMHRENPSLRTLDIDDPQHRAEIVRLWAGSRADGKSPDGLPLSIPALVRTVDGEPVGWWVGYMTPEQVARCRDRGEP